MHFGGTADQVELFPEVGEGLGYLIGVLDDKVGVAKGEDSEGHGDAVVAMGIDWSDGVEGGRGETELGGGLGDVGTHFFEFFF